MVYVCLCWVWVLATGFGRVWCVGGFVVWLVVFINWLFTVVCGLIVDGSGCGLGCRLVGG